MTNLCNYRPAQCVYATLSTRKVGYRDPVIAEIWSVLQSRRLPVGR